ncbi:hypothetical protein Voc01_036060 [Virgisporangium ochraceum]|uniref:DUF308 domain-containing protein n=2 Tax=Virgisporangium ochraceum TaxID=65505 RepID=A0A8J3ZQN7_9ACTN|nr:hypothetical protein Voc01_036060 [Virgisporangium ochraceum]
MASAYEPVGDVDPRVGEHLLDVLGTRGIAAYLQPSTDLHPITRTTSLPARPTDRLFVDREQVDTARAFVRRVTAEQAAERAAESAAERAAERAKDRAKEPAEAADPPAVASESESDGEDPVDRRRDQSRRHLRRRTDPKPQPLPGEAAEPDVDSAWAAIVAGYHLTAETDGTTDTGPRVTLDPPRLLPTIDPNAEPRPRAEEPEPSLLDALDTFGATLPDVDEDDEGYTPPPAPPLPRISAAAALGVAAIVGGLLLFVWPDLMPLARNTTLVLAFGLIVAGFGTLIWRLRPGDDEDDDYDDGARI